MITVLNESNIKHNGDGTVWCTCIKCTYNEPFKMRKHKDPDFGNVEWYAVCPRCGTEYTELLER